MGGRELGGCLVTYIGTWFVIDTSQPVRAPITVVE